MTQQDKAEAFAALHHTGQILILPNAWDAASAAVMEDAGARAVATSSAAVAWAHGYPDGDALPLEKLLGAIATVARVVAVPVTADIEGGYTDDLDALAETIRAVIGAGAVSPGDLAHTLSSALALPLLDLSAVDLQRLPRNVIDGAVASGLDARRGRVAGVRPSSLELTSDMVRH